MSDAPTKPDADKPPVYAGHLKRGPTPDTIVGVLTDQWGWEIHLEGVRNPAGGGYTLMGRLGAHIPPTLRQPVIDGVA